MTLWPLWEFPEFADVSDLQPPITGPAHWQNDEPYKRPSHRDWDKVLACDSGSF